MKNIQEKMNDEQFESYIKTSLSEAPSFDVTANDVIRIHSKKASPSYYYRLNILMSKYVYIPAGVVVLAAFAFVVFGTGQDKVAVHTPETIIRDGVEKVQVVPSEVLRKPLEIATLEGGAAVDAIVDSLFADQADETLESLAVIESSINSFSVDDIDLMTTDINRLTI